MESLATEAGRVFIAQGVLGALNILLIAALIYAVKQWRDCYIARLSEMERLIEARIGIEKALNANTLALEATNRASDARTRASEEIAREVAELRQEVELAVQRGEFDGASLKSKLDDMIKKIEALQQSLYQSLSQRGQA